MPKNSFFRLDDSRKEELYDCAAGLFIEKNYEDITMKNVLECLQMNPGTFYRYFDDKDDLYCYVVQRIVHKRVTFFQQSNSEVLFDSFLSGLFSGFDENLIKSLKEKEIQFLKTFSSIPEELLLKVYVKVLKGKTFPLIKDVLRQMRMNGYLRPDIDDDMISFMFESMQLNLIMFFREYHISDFQLQEKIGKYFGEFMSHGLIDDSNYKTIRTNHRK